MSLTGPSATPASGQEARHLVVLLHGLGADGHDLFSLVPFFAAHLPDAAFLSPHAPAECDLAPMGRQWFSLRDLSPQAISDGIRAVAPDLNRFLDDHLAARGLTNRDLVLVGFSQGAMMALHVALRRPQACAAVIAYSGLLAAAETLPHELTARPPVLLVHGQQDEVVAHAFLPLAESALQRVGVPVLALSLPDLDHGINDEGLQAGIRFISQCLGVTEASS